MTSTTSVDTTALNKDQKDVYDKGKELLLAARAKFPLLSSNIKSKTNFKLTAYAAPSPPVSHKFDCGLLKFLVNQSLKQDTDLKNALTCTTTTTLEIYEGIVPATTTTNNNSGNNKHAGGGIKTSKKPFTGGNDTPIPIYVKVAGKNDTQIGQLFKLKDGILCFVFSTTGTPCFEFIVKEDYAVANYPNKTELDNNKQVYLKLTGTTGYTADKKAFYTSFGETSIYGSLNDTMDVNITTSVKCEKNGDKTVCTPADTSTLFTLFGYNVSKTSAALATAAALGSVYLYRKMKKKSKRKTDSSSSGKKSSHSNRKSSKRGK
jgi:hypothetical protein